MKQCAICGHAAERGSICHDCRAAIKRARDRTVSQFQSLPTFAMAGAAALPEMRVGRSTPDRRGARPHPPRVKPAPQPSRKSRVPMAPAQGSVLLEVPPGTRSAPFVWVIVTLMVFVVTYVAYRVIVTASETLAADVPAAPAGEETVSAPIAPVTSAPSTPPVSLAPAAPAVSALTAAPTPGSHAQEPVTKTVPPAKPAERRNALATAPAPEVRSAPTAKDATPPREDASARGSGNAAPAARNDVNAPAEVRPARIAGAGTNATARSRDNLRGEHWQRMATAIKACVGQDFLGGVLCEQKVRIEYCEGYWGQAPECPGGVANDHGQ